MKSQVSSSSQSRDLEHLEYWRVHNSGVAPKIQEYLFVAIIITSTTAEKAQDRAATKARAAQNELRSSNEGEGTGQDPEEGRPRERRRRRNIEDKRNETGTCDPQPVNRAEPGPVTHSL